MPLVELMLLGGELLPMFAARRRLPLRPLCQMGLCAQTSISTFAPGGEGGDLHRASRRPMVAHSAPYASFTTGKSAIVGDEDGHLGDVAPARAAIGQHRRDVRQCLARLTFGPALGETTGSGIEPDLTRQHQPVSGPHGRRVGPGDGRLAFGVGTGSAGILVA